MISVTQSGSFNNTTKFLKRMKNERLLSSLDKYGRQGVQALSSATPIDTSLTAHSWTYETFEEKGAYVIVWINDNVEGGIPVVIMLQYGHGTGTGGYVQGRDYINPAIKPVFDRIAADVWRVVTQA